MEITALISAIKDWTPSTIIAICTFTVAYFLKKFDSQAKLDREQTQDFKDSLKSGLAKIEEKVFSEFGNIKHELEQQKQEIEALKKDKLERTDFYRDMGGWRNEINNLQKLIITRTDNLQNSIIDIWKEKK